MYQMFRSQFLAFSIYQSKFLNLLTWNKVCGYYIVVLRLELGFELILSSLDPVLNLLINSAQIVGLVGVFFQVDVNLPSFKKQQ